MGKLLIESKKHFQFYTCGQLRAELHAVRPKLRKLSKLSDNELDEITELLLANITTINEDLISPKYLDKAAILVSGIDPSDAPFIALSAPAKSKTLDWR